MGWGRGYTGDVDSQQLLDGNNRAASGRSGIRSVQNGFEGAGGFPYL